MNALKRKIQLTVYKGGEIVFVSGDLRVDFVVDNMVGNALNTAKITAYNLAPDVVQAMSVRDSPLTVTLEVGTLLEPTLTTLFEGDLINIHHTPMFQDTLTYLWCWQKGGMAAQATPKPPKTFTNMTVEAIATQIVNSLLDENGQASYSISFEKVTGEEHKTLVPTYVYTKTAQVALKELLARVNLQYNLSGGVYQVAEILTKEGQEQVIAINSGVEVLKVNFLKKPVAFSIANANVVYNLSPEIEPLKFIKFESPEETASTVSISEGTLKLAKNITNVVPRDYYQVLKVVHRGSCYTDEWETEIRGIVYLNSIKD